MLSKQQRFNVLSSRGFSSFFRGKTLLIKEKPNNLTHSRFGVFLGKKNSPLANQRNALKRQIFSFVEKNNLISLLKSQESRDFLIIILAKIDRIEDNKSILKEELKQAFNV